MALAHRSHREACLLIKQRTTTPVTTPSSPYPLLKAPPPYSPGKLHKMLDTRALFFVNFQIVFPYFVRLVFPLSIGSRPRLRPLPTTPPPALLFFWVFYFVHFFGASKSRLVSFFFIWPVPVPNCQSFSTGWLLQFLRGFCGRFAWEKVKPQLSKVQLKIWMRKSKGNSEEE